MAPASIPPTDRMYRLHAPIYDATRWAFLQGRRQLVEALPADAEVRSILEVGSGTGFVTRRLLAKYPRATLQAVEPSVAMRKRARRRLAGYLDRVTFLEHALADAEVRGPVDLAVFSYSLSMMNPGWSEAIEKAASLLRYGGRLAVVDFHEARCPLVRWWLRKHHVRAEAHLRPYLQARVAAEQDSVQKVAAGLWETIMFIGVREVSRPSDANCN